MKKLLVATIVAVVAAGCASNTRNPEVEELKKRLDQAETEFRANNNKMLQDFQELVNKNQELVNLSKRVTDLESLVKVLEAKVDRLELKVKTMANAPQTDGGGHPDTTKPNTANPVTRIGDILIDLKSGKIDADTATGALKPYSRDAVPMLYEELRKNIADALYSVRLEKILSKLPPTDLQVPTAKALDDKVTRLSAARIVGLSGDFELSKILEPYTSTSDDDFKLYVGEALVLCKNAAGLPPLIQSLRSADWSNRTIAFNNLKKLKKETDDFGYKPSASPDMNAEAIRKWTTWADENKDKVFEKK